MSAAPVSSPPLGPSRPSPLRAGGPVASLLYPGMALALLLLFNLCFTANFFHVAPGKVGGLAGTPIDILKNGTPTLLLTLGMTLVIATGGIDLSVGAVMAVSAAITACLIAKPEASHLTPMVSWLAAHGIYIGTGRAVTVALFVGLLAGLFNGVLVAFLRLQPIIATLILMVAGRGIAQYLTGGQHPGFESPFLDHLGSGFLLYLPTRLALALAIFVAMLLLVRGSALGLLLEAVGNNPIAARLAGVNATGLKVSVYALSGMLSALAGVIAASDLMSVDPNTVGLYLELDAILAAAIGGTVLAGGRFSLMGSLIGALTIQTLTNTFLARNIRAENSLIFKAGIVIGVCLLQSPQFRSLVLKPFKRRAA